MPPPLRPWLTATEGVLTLHVPAVLADGRREIVVRQLDPDQALRLAADLTEALAGRHFTTVRKPTD